MPIDKFIDPEQQAKMLELNPWRNSWIARVDHNSFNNIYMRGWHEGKCYMLQKFIDYLNDNHLDKEVFSGLFHHLNQKDIEP